MTTTGSVTLGTGHQQVALSADQVEELAAGNLACPVCSECCAVPIRRHAEGLTLDPTESIVVFPTDAEAASSSLAQATFGIEPGHRWDTTSVVRWGRRV